MPLRNVLNPKGDDIYIYSPLRPRARVWFFYILYFSYYGWTFSSSTFTFWLQRTWWSCCCSIWVLWKIWKICDSCDPENGMLRPDNWLIGINLVTHHSEVRQDASFVLGTVRGTDCIFSGTHQTDIPIAINCSGYFSS